MSPRTSTTRVLAVLTALVVATSVMVPVGVTATTEPSPTGALGATNDSSSTQSDASTKISSKVEELVSGAESGDTSSSLASETDGETTVLVRVEAKAGEGSAAVDAITNQGGDIRSRYDELVLASVATSAVDAIADSSAVARIVLPRKASTPGQGNVTSEGIDNIDADTLHAQGVNGSGVTVAIIDQGFNVSNAEITDNVAGFKNFETDGGMDNTTGLHGTAVAEVLVDTAPNVSLVLYEATFETEVLNAIDNVTKNTDADVASMSLGFKTGPFDGTSQVDRAINTSVHRGTAWFVAAGNEADGQHYNQTWSDPNGNGSMNFTGAGERLTIEASPGADIYVNWNDSSNDPDYDAYLYQNGTEVASSKRDQSFYRSFELFRNLQSGTYTLEIRNVSANGAQDFDVFASGATLVPNTSARSVTRPATEENAVAVGAVYHGDGSIEPFSSRGPTIDGRTKPRVVAPDGVSTSQPPDSGLDTFSGTSAAAPHAAGIAVLLEDATDGQASSWEAIESVVLSADRYTPAPPDNTTGYGLVNATQSLSYYESVFNVSGDTTVSIEQVPGSTTFSGKNTTRLVTIRPDANLTIDNGSNYRFNVTNGDTGNAVTLEANGSGLVSAPDGHRITFGLYEGDGSVDSTPVIIARPNVGIVEARVVGGSIPKASGVTNFSVGLINVSANTEVARTASKPSVVGYEGNLSQNATRGTVKLTLPQDVLPKDADVDLFISNGDLSGDRTELQMSYASGTFVTTIDASDFGDGNYSWEAVVDWQNFQIFQVRGPDLDGNENITLRTETVTVTGQVSNASNSPAVNDTVIAYTRAGNGSPPNLSVADEALINDTGYFTLTVPENGTYDLAYYQADLLTFEDLFPRDGNPDIYGLTRVRVGTSDDSVGTFELEAAYDLNVSVVNESSHPVENATIAYVHATGESYAASGISAIEALTNADGLADVSEIENASRVLPGLEVAGNVTVFAKPPDGDQRFVNQTYETNLTVTQNDRVTITLNESETTVSIAEAIDADDNGRIGDFEILDAIAMWRDAETVPGTGGKTIGDFKILELIELWRDGTEI